MRFPLFVLVGDPFLCEEKRKEILTALEREFSSSLPLTVRRAGEVSVTAILAEARTLPFLAPAQAFSLREAEQFTKNDLALWGDYFRSPHPRTFFFFEAASLGKGHPFQEWAARAKQFFFLSPQSERIVARFIQEKLRQAGKKMTPEAQGLLEARVGDAFLFLDSFLDQLILYTGEREEIGPSDVEAFEERLTQWEGGDLLQALSERDISKALAALKDLLEFNVRDFPSVVGLLHWQFRRFWEAKTRLVQGATEGEVSSRLGLSPARAPHFFRQVKRFSLVGLEQILEGLFRLDWRLKTGRAEGRYEIETWLIDSMSLRK